MNVIRATVPTVPIGSALDGVYELAPGVMGYAVEKDGTLYVPFMAARRPGTGDVGRFLDALATESRPVIVPNVISVRLRGMLERRGWIAEERWSEENEEHVEVYVRPPNGESARLEDA